MPRIYTTPSSAPASGKQTTRRDLSHRQSGATRRLQPVGKSGGDAVLRHVHVEAEKKGQPLQLLYGFGDSIL